MELTIHVHVHDEPSYRVIHRLDDILTHLRALTAQEKVTMTIVQDIRVQADKVMQAVAAESDKDDSIIALVEGQTALITSLKEQLAAAIDSGADPVALQAVLDSLTTAESSSLANAAKVVAAVNKNTPTV